MRAWIVRMAILVALGGVQIVASADESGTIAWSLSESVSPIDDSNTVILTSVSEERFPNRIGALGRARLLLRCLEGQTSLMLEFNDNFMTDTYVTFRLDSEPAFTRRMTASTSNTVLGFWRSLAIPSMQEMFGHEKLVVRAAPYNQSPITVSFNISNLENEIEPLRKACDW